MRGGEGPSEEQDFSPPRLPSSKDRTGTYETARHPEWHSFRGQIPTAHTLACLRFADLVTETVARLTTGSGGLTPGRTGFAPAGRRIEIPWSHRCPPIPIDQQGLVASEVPILELPIFTVLNLHFVPEPGTLLLLGSGVVGLAIPGRKRSGK